MNFLEPTQINKMRDIYKRYPGPFAIDEKDLNKIFPSIHKNKTKESGDWVQGNLPIQNLKFINLLVKYLKPRLILEIGTFKGRTTLNMAKNSPKSEIITIDPALDCHYYSGNDKQYFQNQSSVGTYFEDTEEEDRITQIFEDSTRLACQEKLDAILEGRKIDFAFIDGGHTYETVRHDFEELVLPRLKDGGVAVFDDYARLYTVIGTTHYLAEKAREGHYVFYWYAPRKTENTNEVIFLNIPESKNYEWEKVK